MVSTAAFDLTYYILSLATVSMLFATLLFGIRLRTSKKKELSWAIVFVLISSGAIIDFIWSVSLTALSRNGGWWDTVSGGLFYQQATYSVVYLGTALVLLGLTRLLKFFWQGAPKMRGTIISLWAGYIGTVLVSCSFLFNPATYAISYSGTVAHVAEQRVFWLPAFLVFAIGAVVFSLRALVKDYSSLRCSSILLTLFFALLFLGSLRESAIIRSTSDPFIDLLIAFGPFAISACCLLASLRLLSADNLKVERVQNDTMEQK